MTMRSLWRDFRLGWRMLARSPVFTTLAVLTLALGIGSTTVIVSFADAAVLSLLNFRDPFEIMNVTRIDERGQSRNVRLTTYEYWRDETGVFDELAAIGGASANLTGVDDPEPLVGYRVTASLLPLLGVEPAAGRGFTAEDEKVGAAPVAMISERLWKRRYGADPGLVGQGIRLDDRVYTVVGVIPQGYYGYGPMSAFVDFWLPLIPDAADGQDAVGFGRNDVKVHGRLRAGLSRAAAATELERVSASLEYVGSDRSDWKVGVAPFYEQVVERRGSTMGLYLAAAGAVLLIACLNVALMMLARATKRRREFAVRSALGSGRLRLIRQLLTESLVVAVAGGIAGVAIAYALLPVVISAAPANMQRSGVDLMSISPFTLGCTVVVSMLAALGAGLVPAFRGSKLDLQTALKATPGAGGPDRGGRRVQDSFVAIAVGASLSLLIIAALLGTSFVRVFETDVGFRREQLLTARIPPPSYKYTDRDSRAQFYADVVGRLSSIPGVRSAAVAVPLPLGNMMATTLLLLEGETANRPSDMHTIHWSIVTPGFFETIGIPLAAGRAFSDADTAEAPRVAIVNQEAARQLWPGENPVGRRVTSDMRLDGPWWTIIGVAADSRTFDIAEDAKATIYHSTKQNDFFSFGMTLVARTETDPMSLVPALRTELSAIDPEAPLTEIRTMERVIDDKLADRRYVLTMVGLFAGVAMLLALVGVYGVVSYNVAQRTQEIGLRMALGAQRSDAFWTILRRVAGVIAVGLALGVGGSLLMGKLIEGRLYEVEPTDPWVLGGAAVCLLLGALFAASLPARRAAAISPMTALRYE